MDWDIDPQAVAKVLQKAGGEAAGFEPVAKDYADYAERSVRQTQATLVGQACADVLTYYQDAWTDLIGQVNASLNGAKEATLAYVHGQEEMALNAQRNATDAAGKRRAAEQRRRAAEGKAQAEGARQAQDGGASQRRNVE
ncbi:DUF6507 family protein [Kribbella karoonensis]|uniref:Excreted virulence factor EspC (Type VII ESX diderm) n=1 Tax=Kribbella karoonensis TaxID=324851 RepID=A0ABN2DPV8_9ACTN|nr:DUF6507 family protein [Kribbella sp.]